jgi:hypothetical protein
VKPSDTTRTARLTAHSAVSTGIGGTSSLLEIDGTPVFA